MRHLMAVALAAFFAFPAWGIVNGYDPGPELDAVGALGLASQMGQTPEVKGAQDHNWHCAATLVTPNVVLTARHCYGVVGWTGDLVVRFRRRVDGGIGSIKEGPGSFHHVHVTAWYWPVDNDIALAYLAEPVNHIQPIQVSLGEPLKPSPLVLAGWGKEGPEQGQGPKERLLACDNTLRIGGGVFFYSAWDPNGPGCGTNNADSGGPNLVFDNGIPRVVGVTVLSSSGSPVWFESDDPRFQELVAGDPHW